MSRTYKECPICHTRHYDWETKLYCDYKDCGTDLSYVDETIEEDPAPSSGTESGASENQTSAELPIRKRCSGCGKIHPFNASRCDACDRDLSDGEIVQIDSVESIPEPEPDSRETGCRWLLISEDGLARLEIRDGNDYIIGREHTLSEYLFNRLSVGRRQARIYAVNGILRIQNLGETNPIMVDRKVIAGIDETEVCIGSMIILGRNPDFKNGIRYGFDDHENCAFFTVASASD